MTLAGKVALVTGASRGIGRAVALKLAEEGADLALVARSAEALEELAQVVRKTGRRAVAIPADLARAEEAQGAVARTVEELGGLALLVNNAGIARDMLLLRMSRAQWDEVLSVDLTSVFLVTQAALKPMLKSRYGRIVSITSVVGLTGNAGQANYAAAKAGIVGFTKSVAREVASRGITLNAVAPGFIETEMTAGLADAAKSKLLEACPMGRGGRPEEVAEAVAFLLADSSGYITGEVLRVDGGLAM